MNFNMNVFLYLMHDANLIDTQQTNTLIVTSNSHRSDVMRCCSFFASFRRATRPSKGSFGDRRRLHHSHVRETFIYI